MKAEHVMGSLLVGGVVLGIVAVVVVIVRLPLDTLVWLVGLLVLGVAVALVIVATAFPIRAKRSGGPRERQVVKETRHTHTIDGRQPVPPHIVTVPQGGAGALFPDIVRAALAAGGRPFRDGDAVGPGAAVEGGAGQAGGIVDGEAVEVRADDEWQGPIYG
jgi:hypothetical protein